MKILSLWFLILLGPVLLQAKPNVVVFFTDDQGTLDARCYGSDDLLTPAIDKLAKELYDKEKAGDVYAIWNPNFHEWIKVGKAIDAYHRCNDYQTSSPFRDYNVVAVVYSDDNAKKEKQMHDIFEQAAEERRNEWFKIDKVTAIKIFNYHVRQADG